MGSESYLSMGFMAGHFIQRKAPNHFELVADDLHVWYIATNDEYLPADLSPLRACLSPEETDRYHRLKLPHVRQNFLLSRGCLRYLLSFYTGLPPEELKFSLGDCGKPKLDKFGVQSSLEFNLSHTQDRIVVALHHHRALGMDIEQVRTVTNLDSMCKHCLTPKETNTVLPLPEASGCHRFLQYWTAKEALLKALGVGLSHPMKAFELLIAEESLTPAPRPVPLVSSNQDDQNQNLKDFQLYQWQPEAGYVAALAVQKKGQSFPDQNIFLRKISPRALVQTQP